MFVMTKFSNLDDWEIIIPGIQIESSNIGVCLWEINISLFLFLIYDAYETFWNCHGST